MEVDVIIVLLPELPLVISMEVYPSLPLYDQEIYNNKLIRQLLV